MLCRTASGYLEILNNSAEYNLYVSLYMTSRLNVLLLFCRFSVTIQCGVNLGSRFNNVAILSSRVTPLVNRISFLMLQ